MSRRRHNLEIIETLARLLQQRRPREMAVTCPKCQRRIVVEKHINNREVWSEYVGKDGYCYDCTFS